MSEESGLNPAIITRSTSQTKELPVCINCAAVSEDSGVLPLRTNRLLNWLSGWVTRRGLPKSKEIENRSAETNNLFTRPASEWVYLPSPAGLSPVRSQWLQKSKIEMAPRIKTESRLADPIEVETTSDEDYTERDEGWRLVGGFLQHSSSQLHRQRRAKQKQYLSASQLGSSSEAVPPPLLRSHSVVNEWMTLGLCPYRKRQHKLAIRPRGNSFKTLLLRQKNCSPDDLSDITFSRSDLSKLSREASPGLYWKQLEHLTGESCSSIYDVVGTRSAAKTEQKSLRASYSADALMSFSRDTILPGLKKRQGHHKQGESSTLGNKTGLVPQSSFDFLPGLDLSRDQLTSCDKAPSLDSGSQISLTDSNIKRLTKHKVLNKTVNMEDNACRTYVKSHHPKLGEIHSHLNSIPESDGDMSTMRIYKDRNPQQSMNKENARTKYDEAPFLYLSNSPKEQINMSNQFYKKSKSFDEDSKDVLKLSKIKNRPDSKFYSQHHERTTTGRYSSHSNQWLQSNFRNDHCFSIGSNTIINNERLSSNYAIQDAVPKTVRDLNYFLDETDRTLLYCRMSTSLYKKPYSPSVEADTLESNSHSKGYSMKLSEYYATYNIAANSEKCGINSKLIRSFSDGHTIKSHLNHCSGTGSKLRKQAIDAMSSTLSLSDTGECKAPRTKEKRRKLRLRRHLVSTKLADVSDADDEADDEGISESGLDTHVFDNHHFRKELRNRSSDQLLEHRVMSLNRGEICCQKSKSQSCPAISPENKSKFLPGFYLKGSYQKKNSGSRGRDSPMSMFYCGEKEGEDGGEYNTVTGSYEESNSRKEEPAHIRAMTEKFESYLKRFGDKRWNTSWAINRSLKSNFKPSPAEKARKRSVKMKTLLDDSNF